MSLSRHLIAAAIGTFAIAAAVADEGVSTAVNPDIQSAAASESYWTPERLASAKPMPIGKVKASDVSSASYGTSLLDFTRSRITPQTANIAAGYKAVGKLYFVIPTKGNFQCSASVIGKRAIVTAAHCVYSDGIGFHNSFVFIPGFDGSQTTVAKQQPFGSWNWASATISNNWINTHGALPNNDDFAVIILHDNPTSPTVSTPISVYRKTGILATAIGHLYDTHVTMLGYPCNFDSCNIMQRVDSGDHRPASTASTNNAFEYGSDMTGGSSGGPWVENFGDPASAAPQGGFATRNAVVGVTSYIFTSSSGVNLLVEGASQFNSNFTTVKTNACGAASTGNC